MSILLTCFIYCTYTVFSTATNFASIPLTIELSSWLEHLVYKVHKSDEPLLICSDTYRPLFISPLFNRPLQRKLKWDDFRAAAAWSSKGNAHVKPEIAMYILDGRVYYMGESTVERNIQLQKKYDRRILHTWIIHLVEQSNLTHAT